MRWNFFLIFIILGLLNNRYSGASFCRVMYRLDFLDIRWWKSYFQIFLLDGRCLFLDPPLEIVERTTAVSGRDCTSILFYCDPSNGRTLLATRAQMLDDSFF